MISLKNVNKNFKSNKVIQDISLTIPDGEVCILLGSSGCGKTTLLRLICGLIIPDSGSVEIEGVSVSSLSGQERAKKLGYIIQEGGLFNHLSVRENIMLPIKILKLNKKQAELNLDKYLTMVNLESAILDKYPLELSGGQRQRAALLRSLIHDPKILLMDEPMSALDPMVRSTLQQDLKRIFSVKKKTVVIVTHDLHEASVLADKIFFVHGGQIEQTGTFLNLIKSPANNFIKEFVQSQATIL